MPSLAAPALVLSYARPHLVIECLRRGDIDPRCWVCGYQLFSVAALARTGTAENERDIGNGW
jgi:hypothetical protein